MKNTPAIATRTYEQLQDVEEYRSLYEETLQTLKNLSAFNDRAQHVHAKVDLENTTVFSEPLVQVLSPCKKGCSACCHTQVSVTEDEARVLVERINNGVEIDLLKLQLQAKAENNAEAFFKLSYQDRMCVFLSEEGSCQVYENRPSVCRTNAVIGEVSQCDTSAGVKPQRLVRTAKADMIIYASFMNSLDNGTLPFMLKKIMEEK